MNITQFKDDLTYYLLGWKNNSAVTENQQKAWPQNRKLSQRTLENGHPNCLRLQQEDGYDGDSVFSENANVRKFFDNENRRWPTCQEDIVRFGIFVHLDFYRSISLCLKAQWEKYYLKNINLTGNVNQLGWEYDPDGANIEEILTERQEKTAEYSIDFNIGLENQADETSLFQFLEKYYPAEISDYSLEQFKILIQDMIMRKMHLFAIDSLEVTKFITEEQKSRSILQQASTLQANDLWLKKSQWIQIEKDVANELFRMENYRLAQENDIQQWFITFGGAYFPMKEAELNCLSIARRIQIKETSMDLSEDEVNELELSTRHTELEELKLKQQEIAIAEMLGGVGGVELQGESLTTYEKEIKATLRRIWLLTHPDKIRGKEFTESQLDDLKEYYHQSILIRDYEKGFDLRSLSHLQDILAQVKVIYAQEGLDIEGLDIIDGDTAEEQLQWLENKIQTLENEIKNIKAEMYALASRTDVKEKKATMANAATIEKYTEQMQKKTLFYTDELEGLEKQYKALFAGGV